MILSDREQCSIYTYGYVENIAAAIVHSFANKTVSGKIYNLGESKSRSRRRWAELYAKLCDWEFEFHVLPEELLRDDGIGRNAPPIHMLIDSTLYSRETGFINPIPLEQSIKNTFNYAAEHPEVLGDKVDYQKETQLLEEYYHSMGDLQKKLTLVQK